MRTFAWDMEEIFVVKDTSATAVNPLQHTEPLRCSCTTIRFPGLSEHVPR